MKRHRHMYHFLGKVWKLKHTCRLTKIVLVAFQSTHQCQPFRKCVENCPLQMCKMEDVKGITFLTGLYPSNCLHGWLLFFISLLVHLFVGLFPTMCVIRLLSLQRWRLGQPAHPHKGRKIHTLQQRLTFILFLQGTLLGMCWPNSSYIFTHGWLNSGRTEIEQLRHAV